MKRVHTCGRVVASGPCRHCEQARERRRGTPAQRGYGQTHRKARRSLADTLPAQCAYCGGWVDPGDDWVAAHVVDGNPEHGWVVAHPRCNERAKVRSGRAGGRSGTHGVGAAIPAPSDACPSNKFVGHVLPR